MTRTAQRTTVLVDHMRDRLPRGPTRFVEQLREKDIPLFAPATRSDGLRPWARRSG